MADGLILRAIRGKAKSLNLNGRRLQRVPVAVGCLLNLTELQLKNNSLCRLPLELSALCSLRVLHLGNNHFEKVPEEIKYLKSLERLHLFGNRITEVPAAVFDGLGNLLFLNLNNNLLEHLPREIYKLERLEMLSINHNHLKGVPKELCLLQNIKELHLADNQLDSLPDEMGYLTNLKELRLSRNQLTGLPEGICKLIKLKILDVAGNYIRSFPSAMHKVPLTELYCEENPLLEKLPVFASQQEEILTLKEITARLILNHLLSRYSFFREQVRQHPEARSVLSSRNICALCGRWFLDMWLECVTFVDVKKVIHSILLFVFTCFVSQTWTHFSVPMTSVLNECPWNSEDRKKEIILNAKFRITMITKLVYHKIVEHLCAQVILSQGERI
ncbi:hypothetical protein XENTR_v10017106 [Xenopus tropicalis]|uniref:Leucine-rich repeat protein SHOC-2 n=1 Tax=Xenopus tropicalis TaxID=8364 RepID=A0A803JVU0_XENTR|nr:hypothetical protein XENTR_v10017106 [Xenopus tropicalis]